MIFIFWYNILPNIINKLTNYKDKNIKKIKDLEEIYVSKYNKEVYAIV